MSEIKATSFRLQEDDIQKFKEFAEENNFNQAEMFTAVLNIFGLARVKGQVVNRAKEIETFQGLMNNLVMMYTNSLIISQTSEERMREELHVELSANDMTIINLHEDKSKLKDEIINYENASKVTEDQLKKLNSTILQSNDQRNKIQKELEEKAISINDYRNQLETLNSIIAEYKVYKDQITPLLTQIEDLNNSDSALTHKGIDLEGQLKNLNDINSFYKEQIDTKDTIYKELNLELKEVKKANEATIALTVDRFNKEVTTLNEKLDVKDENYKELSLELKTVNKENEVSVRLTREKQDKEISILNERLDTRNNKYEKLKDDYSDLHNRFTVIELQNKPEVPLDN